MLATVPVPVLAAGGITDARSLAAVLAAGAAGARIGTRFIAASESGAHPDYVSAVLRAGPSSTEITDAFAVCPLCATLPRARVLSSAVRAVARPERRERGHHAHPRRRHGGAQALRDVATCGHINAMALYAGQAVGVVTEVQPAAEILDNLVRGAEDLLRGW